MDNGILAAGAQDIDFMIHGLFSYKIFGHEVWITTSHVCILIIMLILIAFSFIVKHKMKAATEVPGGFHLWCEAESDSGETGYPVYHLSIQRPDHPG